jgi:hypothetical protein
MLDVQLDVIQFHMALDIPIGDTIKIRRPALRESLILEECNELLNALRTNRVVEAIDGICAR